VDPVRPESRAVSAAFGLGPELHAGAGGTAGLVRSVLLVRLRSGHVLEAQVQRVEDLEGDASDVGRPEKNLDAVERLMPTFVARLSMLSNSPITWQFTSARRQATRFNW
jgi:hypothetical protein